VPQLVPQAGGIAFRASGRDLSILLVTSKKQQGFWIFPKGHIEPGETAAQAGVRETEEEAGVTGELLGPVGAPLDGRTIAWLPYEEALQRLSFDDTGRLLREARARMEGTPRG
jgi:8-oxo-dGTP pyrophosphatase MutT (NUDIX family)